MHWMLRVNTRYVWFISRNFSNFIYVCVGGGVEVSLKEQREGNPWQAAVILGHVHNGYGA